MKLFNSVIATFFVLIPLLSSCQEDHDIYEYLTEKPTDFWENENEFTVIDGMIAKPEWLAEAVDSVAKSHSPNELGLYLYPIVYKVTHAGTEYYRVCDWISSMRNDPVFTLKGERITGDEAGAIINDENTVVMWVEALEEMPTTKTLIGPANVYTPNGSLVQDCWYTVEHLSSYDVSYLTNRTAIQYPNATILSPATATYNCHSYAWNIREGGETNIWIGNNTDPTSIYWHDGSYVSASAGDGTKVSYLDGNHSAITTGTPNVFISKWGRGPLMRHAYNYSPYGSNPNIIYLKENDIPNYPKIPDLI